MTEMTPEPATLFVPLEFTLTGEVVMVPAAAKAFYLAKKNPDKNDEPFYVEVKDGPVVDAHGNPSDLTDYDPTGHNAADVKTYLGGLDKDGAEYTRVVALEKAGADRKVV